MFSRCPCPYPCCSGGAGGARSAHGIPGPFAAGAASASAARGTGRRGVAATVAAVERQQEQRSLWGATDLLSFVIDKLQSMRTESFGT